MSPEGFFAIVLSLYSCLYATSRKQLFYSFSFFSIFFLGVVQVDILLAMRAFELDGLFQFNIDENSLHTARLIFILINLFGIFFMKYFSLPIKNVILTRRYLKFNIKAYLLISISIFLILSSLFLASGSYDSGRPDFAGIGIVLGLLLPLSLAQILLSNKYIYKYFGLLGLLVILVFSRILVLIALLSIIIYKIKLSEWKMPSVSKLSILGVIILMGFFISGQFKHLIGQGIAYDDAFLASIQFYTWLFDFSAALDRSNLGIATNYIIGIEWGSELADCIYNDKIGFNNLLGTFNEIYNSLFPNFIRYQLDLNLTNLSCNAAIVKSPLIDFFRAFGYYGLPLFIVFLWSYISNCEKYLILSTDNFKIFCVCIFGSFSIFLIRGSIGAFISFSIALIVGLFIIKLSIDK